MRQRIATRLSIVLVIIVATSAILTGVAVTQSGTHLLVDASTARLAQESKVISIRLQDVFESVQRDVKFLVRSPAVRSVVNTMETGSGDADQSAAAALARTRLQEVFAALLNNHPWYVQIRLVSNMTDESREVVRVDQVQGQVLPIPDAELQQNRDRNYFLETLNNPSRKVVWSVIDLNREHGQIAEPLQPVLRAGQALAGKDGTPFGVVIINLDVRRVFETAREVVAPDLSLYIANNVGDYLHHPDPDKTFGFEREQRFQMQDDFTEAVFQTEPGAGITLEEIQLTNVEDPVVAYLSRLQLEADNGNDLLIGLTLPRATILEEVNQSRRHNAAFIIPLVLIGAIVVVWMVRILIAPLERVTREVSRYSPGQQPHLPEQDRQDEVGQLAQAFARMAGRIEQQITELEIQGKRFRSLFEAVPDAVVIIDEDGSVEYSNPATERLFGYRADELHGHNVRMLMPEPYRSHHDGYMQRYLNGGEAHIIGVGRKVVGLHKTGKIMPLYLSIGVFTLKGRRKFTGILHDISAHAPERQSS